MYVWLRVKQSNLNIYNSWPISIDNQAVNWVKHPHFKHMVRGPNYFFSLLETRMINVNKLS